MKRICEFEEDAREAEAKRRRTDECLDTIAHAYGPSQDIFLHLCLLDTTHASAVWLSRASREWNASYKQFVATYVTVPLNRYLDGVTLAYDAFVALVEQPNALRLGADYDFICPPRKALAQFLLPPSRGNNRLIHRWASELPRTDSARICAGILLNNEMFEVPTALTEIFPGFRHRQIPGRLCGGKLQYLDDTTYGDRIFKVLTLRRIDHGHWRAYIRSVAITSFPTT